MHRNTAGPAEALCIASVGSNTQAMRAKRVLVKLGIPAAVKKTERGGRGSKGCMFGISYPCLYQVPAETALSNAGIPVTEFWNDG